MSRTISWDMLVEVLRSPEISISKRVELAEEYLEMIDKQRVSIVKYIGNITKGDENGK